MELYTVVLSLITGFGVGALYGLFFLLQARRRVSPPTERYYPSPFTYALLRMITLCLLWFFLLRSPSINLILVLVSFLTAFWLVILNDKAVYDRSACSGR